MSQTMKELKDKIKKIETTKEKMTKLTLRHLAINMLHDAHDLLETKSDDYALGTAFDNFEKVTEICKIMELDINNMAHDPIKRIISKALRLRSLEGKEPKHESVRDTCLDGINFFIIYYAMFVEASDGVEKYFKR